MSKIGKQPIIIPQNAEVKMVGRKLSVKGPKGELSIEINPEIEVKIEDKKITLSIKNANKKNMAMWGTTRMLIQNMIKGAIEGFEKKLEIQGIGYKAALQGKNKLILSVGFTHPVEITAPERISFAIEKNIIVVSGIDKQEVGQIAAKIRATKPPEPYLGKGIRYVGEYVIRKVGKKAAAAATPAK